MLAASFWSSPAVSALGVVLAAAISALVAILAVRRGNRADQDVKETADEAGERDRLELVMSGLTALSEARRVDNKELREELANVKASVREIQARLDRAEAAFSDLRTRERELERENGVLRSENEAQQIKIEAQALRIEELEARVRELEKANGPI